MTANISQRVVSRSRTPQRSFPRLSGGFSRLPGRPVRGRQEWASSQRGSVDHTTITVAAGLLALVVVGMLGFFYLRQVVDTASQGGDIHELEASLSELKERQRQLELEGAQLRSLQTVEQRVQDLNLVEAEHVSYLAAEDDRLARTNP